MRFAVLLAAVLLLQDDGKAPLRWSFAAGEKVVLEFSQSYKVHVDEIPEEFAEIVGEDPVEVKLSGEARLEVTSVKEDGSMVLEGRIWKLKASGYFLVNDIVFAYDREKDGDAPKEEPAEGPGNFGVNPDKALRAVATEKVTLTISPRGKVGVLAAGDAGGYAERIFDLGGVVGLLPEEPVGPGSTWKGSDSLRLPSLPILVKVESTTTYEKRAEEAGAPCAMLVSTYKVSSEPAEAKEGDMKLKIEGSMEGKGEGKSTFQIESGRPRTLESKLTIKATLKVPGPSGDEIEIKGRFDLKQSAELKREKA